MGWRARGLAGMTSPLRGEGHAFESHRAHQKCGKTMRNRIEKGEELIAMASTASAGVGVGVGANGEFLRD